MLTVGCLARLDKLPEIFVSESEYEFAFVWENANPFEDNNASNKVFTDDVFVVLGHHFPDYEGARVTYKVLTRYGVRYIGRNLLEIK